MTMSTDGKFDGDVLHQADMPSDAEDRLMRALDQLVGQPLREGWRAVGIDCFGFGAEIVVRERDGFAKAIARHQLHLQCSWGLLRNGEVVVGRLDHFFLDPTDDNDRTPDRADRLLADFMAEGDGLRTVVRVELSRDRDLDIVLDDGSTLQVRPLRRISDGDKVDEYWRLFEAHAADVPQGDHLVVGNDIQIQ